MLHLYSDYDKDFLAIINDDFRLKECLMTSNIIKSRLSYMFQIT